jgi:hypothetical protein
MRRPQPTIVSLIAALLVAACGVLGPTPVPSAPRPLGPGEIWLPVIDVHDGHAVCAGGGTIGDFRLHGSATDPRLVWMTEPDGRERSLVWPLGTSARFVPGLEVLDPRGTVIAREGTGITGTAGCSNGLTVEFEEPEASTGADGDSLPAG